MVKLKLEIICIYTPDGMMSLTDGDIIAVIYEYIISADKIKVKRTNVYIKRGLK